MGNKLAKLFSNIDVSQSPYDATDIPKINTPFQYRSGKLQILNPAQSFVYSIVSSAIAGNYNLTLPLITGNDVIAVLGLFQRFTKTIDVQGDAGIDEVIQLVNPIKTVGEGAGMNFRLNDSADAETTYGSLYVSIVTNTAGAVDSRFSFWTRQGGVGRNVMRIGADGILECGGINRRIKLDDTGMTAQRLIRFQDAAYKVAGIDIGNTFTVEQVIKVATSGALFSLYRPSNVASNGCRFDLCLDNSLNAQTAYGRLSSTISVNTNGVEMGHLEAWNMISGTLTKCLTFNDQGSLDLLRGLFIEGVISPSQITSNQNDYNPTNLSSNITVRLNADLHGRKITGLSAPGNEGDIKILINVGTKDIVLSNQDTGSTTAGDRFLLGNNHILYPDTCLPIIYDATTSRWRPLVPIRVGTTGLRQRPPIFSDFLRETANCISPFDNLAISSGTIATATANAEHPGIIEFTSSTTANSGYAVRGSNVGILLAGGEAIEAVIQFPGFTNNTVRIGLHDATTVTAPVDGVYFEMSGSSTVSGKTMSNSTGSTTGTTFTASTGVWYRLKIIVSATNRVDFYIYDDNGVEQWKDSLTTNIPNGAGRSVGPCAIGTNSTTTGGIATLDLDYMAFFPGYIDALAR